MPWTPVNRARNLPSCRNAAPRPSGSPGWSAPGPSRAQQAEQVDFDGDGFADLAVGAPGEAVGAPIERVGSQQAAGAVSVFYASGGPGGVVTPGPAFFQGSGGLGGTAEAFDFFGAALE